MDDIYKNIEKYYPKMYLIKALESFKCFNPVLSLVLI